MGDDTTTRTEYAIDLAAAGEGVAGVWRVVEMAQPRSPYRAPASNTFMSCVQNGSTCSGL